MTYIYQLSDWPKFRWDRSKLTEPLAAVRHRQGHLLGQMEGLGFRLRREATLNALTDEVMKSSEIEGERLDAGQVRPSIARRLGIDIGALKPADRHVEGIVAMMIDATGNYERPLTSERLFGWHASLFPTGWSGLNRIKAGAWRDDASGPMQVVSGVIGAETVHFEAPPAERLGQEMTAFLEWFNAPSDMDDVLKAGLAHLWFVTIHPFEDGNGRMGRAVTDMQLARSEKSAQRFYSMSSQIREKRQAYYEILKRTQTGTMDATGWMEWFLGCLDRAIEGAQEGMSSALAKARYWESLEGIALNDRQRTMINRLLDGFDGKLTNAKWAKITKCSPDTALRDIQHLVDHGVLARGPEGGRSTSYTLRSRAGLG